TMVGFEIGLGGYSTDDGRRFQQRALEAVRALPGVTSAAYGNSLPLSIDQSHANASRADRPLPQGHEVPLATQYQVSPGYFRTLGIRMLQGRDIDWRDTSDRPLVAVVNAAFARLVMQTSDAVGLRIRWGRGTIAIVGIVEDGKYQALTETATPALFV